jgi:hypothetical protein
LAWAMNCRSRGRTTVGVGVVALAAALFAAAGAGSGSATIAARASVASLQFPPQTPRWLVEAETRTASGLGDPNATVISVTLGRFPIVVLEGKFVCNACSHGPSGAAAPTGNYAATRFDGVTHQSSDFGLSQTLAAATASLCNGSPCTTNATYLDAAFRALDAHSRAVSEPFDHRFGSSHCKIRLPVSEIKWIWGSCQVQMRANSSGALRLVSYKGVTCVLAGYPRILISDARAAAATPTPQKLCRTHGVSKARRRTLRGGASRRVQGRLLINVLPRRVSVFPRWWLRRPVPWCGSGPVLRVRVRRFVSDARGRR